MTALFLKESALLGLRKIPIRILGSRSKHTLPDLPYDYNALEPTISADIMRIHHSKHHATYVNNLNIAEEQLAEAIHKKNTNAIIRLAPVINFNGGGHINHTIFWQNLSPSGGPGPDENLLSDITKSFSSFEEFKEKMSAAAISVQGSGWAWLGYCKKSDRLSIVSKPNQDPLQPTTGLVPIFGIDVWEHAYYLQYKNARPDYVKAIWKIVNWPDLSERLAKAKLG